MIENNTDSSVSLSSSSNYDYEIQEMSNITNKQTSQKKKRKRKLTICLTNCRYDVVRKIAKKFNMCEVSESDDWDLYWTDLSISIERAKDMKRFQRINHFPGMLEICRKDLLARNLNRMLKLFPNDYGFFPKTWCFPPDLGDALTYSRLNKNKTYILKPDCGSQGRGIYLTRSLKDIKVNERMICQVYLSKPFLIDGYKFDLRVYTLITSCDPLRIYVYNEGLARFATSRYREPSVINSTNVFMHLTNYAVNKHSRTFDMNGESGSKRKISSLNRHFKEMGYDVQKIWENIDEVIVKTIISAWPILKHSYHACFPSHNLIYACFELLGFDILLDHKLKPYILEVNHSPSFNCDTTIDADVKSRLLHDTFAILDISRVDKHKILKEDRRRIRGRLLQGIHKDESNNESVVSNSSIMQDKREALHLGDFRQAYPGLNPSKYQPFFNQIQSTLYSQTVSSKARDMAVRLQREEFATKTKLEAAKRLQTKNVIQKKNEPLLREIHHNNSNSFVPGIIVESEERERRAALMQRDLLIRNNEILQQIYFAMKMNGSLRLHDEEKYEYLTMQHAITRKSSVIVPQMIDINEELMSISKDIQEIMNKAYFFKQPEYLN